MVKRKGSHNSPDPSVPFRQPGTSDRYEPSRESKRRKMNDRHENDTQNRRRDGRYDDDTSSRRNVTQRPNKTTNKLNIKPASYAQTKTHTRTDRKNNRSTRIHSIRSQLNHGNLPPNIRIEKERELKSLVFDQQKAKLAKESNEMIGKYHMVRFFERKKAERKLKQLVKQRDVMVAENEQGPSGISEFGKEDQVEAQQTQQRHLKNLDRQIRVARVDLNYTLYSPLSEKYISIFAGAPVKNEDAAMPKLQLIESKKPARTSTDHWQESQKPEEIEQDSMMLGDSSSKPPIWHEVEAIMYPATSSTGKYEIGGIPTDVECDEAAVKKDLDLLRERKPVPSAEGGPRDIELFTRPTQDGVDRPGKTSGKKKHSQKRIDEDHIKSDDVDSDSDGDGGFFER